MPCVECVTACTHQGREGSSPNSVNCSSVADTETGVLFCYASSRGCANIVTQVRASTNVSTQSAAASVQAHVGVRCLDVIRNTLAARGLSRDSVDIIGGS